MHIFLDESGTFAGVGADQPAISVIGALVFETSRLPKLFSKYERMRLDLPKNPSGEVKGSLLNEGQVAAVLDLIRRNGGLFFATMIDMADHQAADLARHRERRIASLAANLTEQHTPELRAGVVDLQRRAAGFSDQLYVQMVLTIDLLRRVLEEMVMYHCQRNSKELAAFHWVVDSKQPTQITDWEDWWSKTLVIWLEAISLGRPGRFLPHGDYRHFQRFIMEELPARIRDHVAEPPPAQGNRRAINLGLMFRESFRFSSTIEAGLELVDIATNALRRALVGNLGENGWLPLRALMIHRRGVYVEPVSLLSEEQRLEKPYRDVLARFREGGRNMATPCGKWPEDKAG